MRLLLGIDAQTKTWPPIVTVRRTRSGEVEGSPVTGDVQLEAKEEGTTFERMKAIGFGQFVENAANCIAIWAQQFAEVEVSADQQTKMAQGELCDR